MIDGDVSSSVSVYILCSVPQGSVPGPRLFALYTADLADVTDRHIVKLHAYTDDSQLYVLCQRHDTASTIVRLGQCVGDTAGHWMAANPLYPAKTELLWAGSKHNISL